MHGGKVDERRGVGKECVYFFHFFFNLKSG